jgi:anti-anti-sigma factor
MASTRKQSTSRLVEGKVVERNSMGRVVEAVRDGDWLPAGDLRAAALEAAAADTDLALNLEGVDYLDGSCLQTLLALGRDQLKRERKLVLVHASPALRQWFDFAGADGKLQFA